MFKDYYESNRARQLSRLDETLSILAEAEDGGFADRKSITQKDFHGKTLRLTEAGFKALFKYPLEKSGDPLPDFADTFSLIDVKSTDGKQTLESYKSEGAYKRIIAYSTDHATFRELPNDFVDIPRDYFKEFMSKSPDSEIYQFANKFYWDKNLTDAENKERGALKSDSINHIRVTREDAIATLKFGAEKVGLKYGIYTLLDEDTDMIYQIIYPAAREAVKIGFMFNVHEGATSGGKLKIKGSTQENETHTLLGFYYDAEELKKKIDTFRERNADVKDEDLASNEQFQNLIEPYTDALHSSKEFNNKSSWIIKDHKTWGYEAWYTTLAYGIPATKFHKEIVKFSPVNIVCKSITEYRDLEEQLMKYGENKIKRSTVDALVSSVPAAELLKLMNLPSTTLHGNASEGYVTVNKDGMVVAKYYQLSLKTKDTDQLGRAQTSLSKKYKFAADASKMFESTNEADIYDAILKEGLISKLSSAAKSGLEVLKKLGKEQFQKLLSLTSKLKSWSSKLLSGIKTYTEANLSRLATELFGLPLTEARNDDIKQIIAQIMSLDEKGKIAKYKNANSKIQNSLVAIKKSSFTKHCDLMYNVPVHVDNYDENLFLRQLFNFAFLESIKNLVIRNVDQKHMEEYVDELVDMYTDSIFGTTTLPVWRLYSNKGLEDSKTPWEYLGTKATQKDYRTKNILNNMSGNDIPLTVIKGTSVKGGYHHFYLYTLTQLVDSDGAFAPMYMEFAHSYQKSDLSPEFRGTTQVSGPIVDKTDDSAE